MDKLIIPTGCSILISMEISRKRRLSLKNIEVKNHQERSV